MSEQTQNTQELTDYDPIRLSLMSLKTMSMD